jgi:TonB family protein
MTLFINLCGLIILFMHPQLYGQTTVVEEYVDEFRNPVEQTKAKYFRIVNRDKDKNLSGKAEYYFLSAGTTTQQLYARGNYEKNSKNGKWEHWYRNGQLKEIGYYLTVEYGDNYYPGIDYKIESFWDSTGNQLVQQSTGRVVDFFQTQLIREGTYVNGQKHGIWQDYFTDGKLRTKEEFEYGVFKEGISFKESGESFTYTIQEMQPQPEGGMPGFMNYIMTSMRYPKEARKKGIQGKVYIQFVVDKDGGIIDVEVLKGIGGGCDEEAVRVMRECPKWSPGIQRGQAVKVRMSIPLIFKLG